ncbi:electron transfer flavoprotein subunit alpha/FixB family protein [Chloroflexota bacterium]
MAEHKGVMIFGEISEGKLAPTASELLGCGRKLADALGEELCAVLAGNDTNELAADAIAFGADKVYLVDDPLLKDPESEICTLVLEKIAKELMPAIILMGQTSLGRDIAPRLAFRLKTSASLDCIGLDIDPDSKLLEQTRPVYGGNAQAVFVNKAYPQIATTRAKVMTPLTRDDSRRGEVINIAADLDPKAIKTRILEKITEEVSGIKLEDASVIISGGRGIGSAEGFKELEKLAVLLDGTVGASRPPCDNEWISDNRQVGLTGKIVTPDLYIAIALSGSSQHMSGCSGAKNIVAINRDPEANIFKDARFGVIGDWKKILPAFTEKVKELLNN